MQLLTKTRASTVNSIKQDDPQVNYSQLPSTSISSACEAKLTDGEEISNNTTNEIHDHAENTPPQYDFVFV